MFPKLIDDVFLTAEKYSVEAVTVKLNNKSGWKTVYIDFNYQPLGDEGNFITDILVMGVDVTPCLLAQNLISKSD